MRQKHDDQVDSISQALAYEGRKASQSCRVRRGAEQQVQVEKIVAASHDLTPILKAALKSIK